MIKFCENWGVTMIFQKSGSYKKNNNCPKMKCFTQYVYKYTVWQLFWKLLKIDIFIFQYIPKTENRYDFGIYRNFKIHTGIFSVYTETSKSIPIFFRYIPKPQNPYRYFFGIYRNLKNHTDIFRYIPYRKIPVFFGIGMVFVHH